MHCVCSVQREPSYFRNLIMSGQAADASIRKWRARMRAQRNLVLRFVCSWNGGVMVAGAIVAGAIVAGAIAHCKRREACLAALGSSGASDELREVNLEGGAHLSDSNGAEFDADRAALGPGRPPRDEVVEPKPILNKILAKDVIKVDPEKEEVEFSFGKVSFSGVEVAKHYQDCPSSGIAYREAKAMFRRKELREEIDITHKGAKYGWKCNETWIPSARLKDLLRLRYFMLTGVEESVLPCKVHWCDLSAVWYEYNSEQPVNYSAEVGKRMMKALKDLKDGRPLKFEKEILRHVNGAELLLD